MADATDKTEEVKETDITAQATALAELHASGDMIIMPTAWDAWSAGLVAKAGYRALTVGSHPVANAFGVPDGENMDFDDYLRVVSDISAAVDIPVSADVESGYDLPANELVAKVLGAGAVGVNVEDTVHSAGGTIRPRDEHSSYIRAIVDAAAAAGVPDFVVNGRTDALIHGADAFEDPIAEAEARIKDMAAAGALSVYPVKIPDTETSRRLVAAVEVPVNVTVHPLNGSPAGDLATLRSIGVRRVSTGPLWQMALEDSVADLFRDFH